MKYQYIILRYNHDTLRNEAFNVGVLLYSAQANFLGFKSRKDLHELKKIFPDFEASKLRSYLVKLENMLHLKHAEVSTELPLKKTGDIAALAHEIIQPDDSSIQWGRIGSGVSKNLLLSLDELNNRYVQQHHPDKHHQGKSDDHVWSQFSKELKKQNLLPLFTPKTIEIQGVPQTYEHTYQNGKLHCLQPLSLDLSSEDNMIEKALKETGRYFLVKQQKNAPDIKMYYLLGIPSRTKLRSNFEHVQKLLSVDKDVEIFTEEHITKLPERLAKTIKHH